MSLAKNVMAMLLITGSLWGCSLNAEKEGGKPGSLAGSQWLVEEIDGLLDESTIKPVQRSIIELSDEQDQPDLLPG